MKRYIKILLPGILIFYSCSAPIDAFNLFSGLERIPQAENDTTSLELPPLTFDEYSLALMNIMDRLPGVVKQNQAGFSYLGDGGVEHHICMPSATPHVVLSRALSIDDSTKVLGEWYRVAGGSFEVSDSLNFTDSTVTRNFSQMVPNEDDLVLVVDESKMQMFARSNHGESFQRVVNRKYSIINGHYLLLYRWGSPGPSAGTSFIGLDPEGKLYMDTYRVEVLLKPYEYQVNKAFVIRSVYRRI